MLYNARMKKVELNMKENEKYKIIKKLVERGGITLSPYR